jgi:hypothetical protein
MNNYIHEAKEDEIGRECKSHEEKWYAYDVLVERPEGKIQIGSHRRR